MPLELAIALTACILAAISDVRTRKIPNVVPLAVALVALAFAAPHGILSVLTVIALTISTMIVGTLAFARGWLGGGDVKLLAAVTGCLGLADALPFLLYTAISGGVLAVCFAIAGRRVPSVLRSASSALRAIAFQGTVAIAPERPIMMPYALAIATSVVLVALSHSVAPFLRLPL